MDIGGSGMKARIVDADTGKLVSERAKLLTPKPATPEAVANTAAEVVASLGWRGPIGITFPGVVIDGVIQTAANMGGVELWGGPIRKHYPPTGHSA
jgi:polyphosphate glucokinase